jgi:small-conductance mechanosensitive channel
MNPSAWLETRFAGNTVTAWLTCAGILVGVTLLLFLLRHLLLARLGRIATQTETEVDDVIVDLVRRTRTWFIGAVALVAGTLALAIPPAWQRGQRIFIVVVVLLQLGLWGNGLIGYSVDRYLRKSGGKTGAAATTLGALGILGRAVLWGMLLLVALDNLGFEVTTIITGLGVGGIAIALAVQNILGDLFAALAIVVDKPFVVGDFVIVDMVQGHVEHVGLKTTRLRALTGEQVVVSNADLLKSRIRNFQTVRERRMMFTFGVQYDTPPDLVAQVPAIVREVIEAQPLTRFDRSHFQRFAESSLDFETVYFVLAPEYATMMDTQQAVMLTLMRRFPELGIQFAFPTRVVHVAGGSGPRELATAGGAAD